jgi:hypothetical protein
VEPKTLLTSLPSSHLQSDVNVNVNVNVIVAAT